MRNRPGRATIRAAAMLAAVGGLLFAAAAAPAAEEKPPPTAEITILAIHGTQEKEPHCDKALLPIKELLARVGGYNSFRLIRAETRDVPYGETHTRTLVEGYTLLVKPESLSADKIKLLWTLVVDEKDEKGETKRTIKKRTSFSIRRGAYLLDGSWKLKKGALLLATRAE